MLHIEFAVLLLLLLWMNFRMLVPLRVHINNVLMFKKLNRIEAHLRGVPTKQIEEELSTEIADILAMERGRPWFASRMWDKLP